MHAIQNFAPIKQSHADLEISENLIALSSTVCCPLLPWCEDFCQDANLRLNLNDF